jgi:hypothetical protein
MVVMAIVSLSEVCLLADHLQTLGVVLSAAGPFPASNVLRSSLMLLINTLHLSTAISHGA